jgi:hypothetical protein
MPVGRVRAYMYMWFRSSAGRSRIGKVGGGRPGGSLRRDLREGGLVVGGMVVMRR